MAVFGKIGSWADIVKSVGTSFQLGALALLAVIALFTIAVKNADKPSVPTMLVAGLVAITLIAVVVIVLYRTSTTAQAQIPGHLPRVPLLSTDVLRPGVIEIFREMQQSPQGIITKLIYSAGTSERFDTIAQVCVGKGFVPVEFSDAKQSEKPREFVHSLIAQANLVVFDLTNGDPEILYELGFQRGIWNVPPDAVFLFTFAEKPIQFPPFEIKKLQDDRELRDELAKALDALS